MKIVLDIVNGLCINAGMTQNKDISVNEVAAIQRKQGGSVNKAISKWMSEQGKKGGAKSRRVLTSEQARAMSANAIRTKHTPNCAHPYTATMKGRGEYGWGNTPQEARECLKRQIKLQRVM